MLEVARQRQGDLLAHVGRLQFSGEQSQVLGRASAAHTARGDQPDGLVVPFDVQVVEGVLEYAGAALVVLGDTMTNPSNEAMVADCSLMWPCRYPPSPRDIGSSRWGSGLTQVDELEFSVVAFGGDAVDPSSDLLAGTVGSGTAERDANSGHDESLLGGMDLGFSTGFCGRTSHQAL